ncbi:MAG: preprotein translocase subunit SecE [Phycisphaerae bacterium]
MSQASSTPLADQGSTGSGSAGSGAPGAGGSGGFFEQYKKDQGKWTRLGTFVGLLALGAWAALSLYNALQVYEGDEFWRVIVTTGIPLAFFAVILGACWWVSYTNRKSSDFMIATEGEMKKVSWSSRSEIIGSTKVVIFFTIVMATLLFLVDLLFSQVFSWIGVLKTGG